MRLERNAPDPSTMSRQSTVSNPRRQTTTELELQPSEDESTPSMSGSTSVGGDGPFRVKMTAFRILVLTTCLGFGTSKAIESLNGGTFSVTWIEWVSGGIFAAGVYWLSFYESIKPPVAPWFFHVDYGWDLIYIPPVMLATASLPMAGFGVFVGSIWIGAQIIVRIVSIPYLDPSNPSWLMAPIWFFIYMIFIGMICLNLYAAWQGAIRVPRLLAQVTVLQRSRWGSRLLDTWDNVIDHWSERFERHTGIYIAAMFASEIGPGVVIFRSVGWALKRR